MVAGQQTTGARQYDTSPGFGLESPEPLDIESGIHRLFVGREGLRAGWSIAIWLMFRRLFLTVFGVVLAPLAPANHGAGYAPWSMLVNEALALLALAASIAVMALIEQRRITEYNLRGPRQTRHFFAGLGVGFAVLSGLMGALAAGGWLHFAGIALSGIAILEFGILWAVAFLMVGCFEEGAFRCYLQATLTRGIGFWWALGCVALLSLNLASKAWINFDPLDLLSMGFLRCGSNGAWGVYALALLGLFPCYLLHRKGGAGSAFWQAAWVTSTLFGFVHTANGGENWIGIFAAGLIGFVFCVSVRLTGSAWWAIGAHAGWDWGETFFYGTPDSGMTAHGHYLNTALGGNALWSGGADGPEGSLLVLAAILLMLAWLLAVYRRGKRAIDGIADQRGGGAASE